MKTSWKKLTIGTGALALALVGGAFAWHGIQRDPARPDCPGKIVCPLTGDLVCADQCPLGADAPQASQPSCCETSQ